MFDDIGATFSLNVAPAYDSYVMQRDANKSGCNRHLRAALNVAATVFHFREHLATIDKRSRREVIAHCPDYRLVADVANAAKHRLLDQDTSEGPPLVRSVSDIEERLVVTQYEDAEGTYTDARTIVLVSCTDGISRSLDTAVTNVFNYWGGELKQMGVLDFSPRPLPENPGVRRVPRSDARNPDFEVLNTIRFRQAIQLLKFDVAKGKSEPVDLTGAEIEFFIYKPAYTADVVVTSRDGSRTVRSSLKLTDEEAAEFSCCTTSEQREEFAGKLLRNRRQEVRQKIIEDSESQIDRTAVTERA